MSVWVVDSSVVVKWYAPEALAAEALRVRDGSTPLHAPDFIEVEVAAIAWKKIRRGEITRPVADQILADLPALGIITFNPPDHSSGRRSTWPTRPAGPCTTACTSPWPCSPAG